MYASLRLCLVLFPCFFPLADAAAADRVVDSLEALQRQAEQAQPGDRVILRDGVYHAELPVNLLCQGTADAPVVVKAETVGGVEIQGRAGFHLLSPSAYVQLEGFVFSHSGKCHLAVGTAHCRVLRNTFENRGVTSYLVVDGDDTEVAYNEFRNKRTVGQMLKIGGAPTRPAERTWVHHNYFHDFTNVGTNGGETIQVAVGENSMRSAYTLIEYNLFERCHGENELISNKSCDNTYRGNTFRDSRGELTLRDGDRILVEGNFFINTNGLRVFGDDTRVVNNYFEGCKPALLVGSGTDPDHILGQPFKAYDRVDRLLVAHNTFVNSPRCVEFQDRKEGLPATEVTLAYNLLQGDEGRFVTFSLAPSKARWIDNLIAGAAAPGDAPEGALRPIAAALVSDGCFFRVAQGSPAIDAVEVPLTELRTDVEGQVREGRFDIGADEWSTQPPRSRPLWPTDVGPRASGP